MLAVMKPLLTISIVKTLTLTLTLTIAINSAIQSTISIIITIPVTLLVLLVYIYVQGPEPDHAASSGIILYIHTCISTRIIRE